ncbi:YhgE/Pip domain-containing protein [Conexibacter sp. CPCC 206217]|uniref:YhgE/Pip domain-containing protein n=1 Tax=Conexibacter sp. CPCC 206217 TaxID=3064574 RepID=UPI0027237B76|nr:ABC transporter permease [Conexibacter sp. CPCC 206217]MDO8212541.1 DUF3533 domain-containing protein [Conexibacter sp. CPCC 206217]
MPRPLGALDLLRKRPLWVAPIVLGAVVIALMTALYIGSVVDPIDRMDGLPVSVVNLDDGGDSMNLGRALEAQLLRTETTSGKLAVHAEPLDAARERMDRGDAYATVVIPRDFTAAALVLVGKTAAPGRSGLPTVTLLTNQRAGTEGASLATGVLQPVIAAFSRTTGAALTAAASGPLDPAAQAVLPDPVDTVSEPYRPLPSKAALGLSAFYVSLLMLMCGFLGATIVNANVDGALGFAPNEIGPRWSQRRPALISRWQTLLTKWAIAAGLTAILCAVVLLVAAALLGMDAPQPLLLWLFGWFSAVTVAIATLSLLAVLGTPGQIAALLIFIYVGLASAGGTVPIEALPEPFALVSHIDPLRQIIDGVRSILYLDASLDAGLGSALVATALGLLFWLCFAAFFVRRYDRQGRHRMEPDLVRYVGSAADGYSARSTPDG